VQARSWRIFSLGVVSLDSVVGRLAPIVEEAQRLIRAMLSCMFEKMINEDRKSINREL